MATSIFSGLARDTSLSRRFARTPDRAAQNGQVLFHSTFENGFDGWRDHYNYKTPYPPIGLTSYPVMSGGHALQLSTVDGPITTTGGFTSGATFKNLARYYDTGLVSFSGYFAHGSGRGANAWDQWGLSLDTQKWDSSSRAFYKVWCQDRTSTTTPAWYLRGATATDNIVIPFSSTSTSGENENKFNFDYVRLTVDFSANGGLGGYYELQVNKDVFDLRTIFAGTPAEPPQTGGATENDRNYSSFGGGMNPGLFINPNARLQSNYPAILVADELMMTVQD